MNEKFVLAVVISLMFSTLISAETYIYGYVRIEGDSDESAANGAKATLTNQRTGGKCSSTVSDLDADTKGAYMVDVDSCMSGWQAGDEVLVEGRKQRFYDSSTMTLSGSSQQAPTLYLEEEEEEEGTTGGKRPSMHVMVYPAGSRYGVAESPFCEFNPLSFRFSIRGSSIIEVSFNVSKLVEEYVTVETNGTGVLRKEVQIMSFEDIDKTWTVLIFNETGKYVLRVSHPRLPEPTSMEFEIVDCGYRDMCANGIKDIIEQDIDCGGRCPQCPTCKDGIKNQGELSIDCGGPCDSDCFSESELEVLFRLEKESNCDTLCEEYSSLESYCWKDSGCRIINETWSGVYYPVGDWSCETILGAELSFCCCIEDREKVITTTTVTTTTLLHINIPENYTGENITTTTIVEKTTSTIAETTLTTTITAGERGLLLVKRNTALRILAVLGILLILDLLGILKVRYTKPRLSFPRISKMKEARVVKGKEGAVALESKGALKKAKTVVATLDFMNSLEADDISYLKNKFGLIYVTKDTYARFSSAMEDIFVPEDPKESGITNKTLALAKQKKAILLTENTELKQKASGLGISALDYKEYIEQR